MLLKPTHNEIKKQNEGTAVKQILSAHLCYRVNELSPATILSIKYNENLQSFPAGIIAVTRSKKNLKTSNKVVIKGMIGFKIIEEITKDTPKRNRVLLASIEWFDFKRSFRSFNYFIE